MRIVIDFQAAQSTDSRNRDIGRYTNSLVKEIVRNSGFHEIYIVINGLFSNSIESVREDFESLLPQDNIKIFYTLAPVSFNNCKNEWRRKVAEMTREAFIASLRPDIVILTSLFDGMDNDAVTSIGNLDNGIPTALILYDLLPMKYGKNYFDDPIVYNWYENKLDYLRRADLLLAISESLRQEAIHDLGIDPSKVINISDASDAQPYSHLKHKETESSGLKSHGTEQTGNFSWDNIALRALNAIENWDVQQFNKKTFLPAIATLPKLAFLSPLPAERSGISDYSAELLPELANYYQIDVVVDQTNISDSWINSNCGIRSYDWFQSNAKTYDRVIYHFGNSPFHKYMFSCLDNIPGVVVLHDFYLSHAVAYMEDIKLYPHYLFSSLYQSHGYLPFSNENYLKNRSEVVWDYPCNLDVLQNAIGVIVHSKHSCDLAKQWYGENAAEDWSVIPMLRTPANTIDRIQARNQLNLGANHFIVCSFGMLGPTKLNKRLLDCWLTSSLSKDENCILIFVGENPKGQYESEIVETIKKSGVSQRIQITGWIDLITFRSYLAAADLGVQLRTLSRGETSAAILDCLNYGLTTIVNANGSIAELSEDVVVKIPDEFKDSELIQALETLWMDEKRRKNIGTQARDHIRNHHSPKLCAKKYAQSIESFYQQASKTKSGLIHAIARIDEKPKNDTEVITFATCLSQNFPPSPYQNRLLVDVSATCRNDLKTGIERVTRALVMALLESPPAVYRVEPVYLCDKGGSWHYRYANHFTMGLLESPSDILVDDMVEPRNGDVLLGLDLSGHTLVEAEKAGLFNYYRNAGVRVYFMVHDLLPLQMPEFFPPGADENHKKWLQAIGQYDGAICVSKTVADDLAGWLKINNSQLKRPFKIGWSHHGADTENSSPTCGLPKNAEQFLARVSARSNFLMVGTIEPRKGYLQTLEAFTQLWLEGFDANLIIVGNEGWKGLPDDMRRTIPEIVSRLRNHTEFNKHLFWFEGISDEYLGKIYDVSTCLIAASEGEGFGLPLIEAAQHRLPLIVRNIPVFREVAGKNAYYFDSAGPQLLAQDIRKWLDLFYVGQHPTSDTMPWLVWRQSCNQLLNILLDSKYNNTRANNSSGILALDFETSLKRLYVDVSVVCRNDFKSGIQRVARSILAQLMAHPPEGYDIIPVLIDQQNDRWEYFWAKDYHRKFSQNSYLFSRLSDKPIEPSIGDIFLGLDLAGGYVVSASQQHLYEYYKNIGVKVYFVIYDLLPVTHPQFFSPPDSACFDAWLSATTEGNGVICISKATAYEYNKWLYSKHPERGLSIDIKWFHLGADIRFSAPSIGLPDIAEALLKSARKNPTFLMVSTIEPRKGYTQALNAFEELWKDDININLVIVGRKGWMVEPFIERLMRHPEKDSRLFWLDGISDEYLEKVYDICSCLLAAAEGEGFGLPLIEAAQHKIPIIARNLPVFREVAGENAFYFDGLDANDLATAIKEWLNLNKSGKAPASEKIPFLTWAQSTEQLKNIIFSDNWQQP